MMISTFHICFNDKNVLVKYNFSERWVLNSDCNQHMTENLNAFIFFILFAEKVINDVENNLVVIDIDSIRLYVKIKNGPFHIIIYNVWYVFNSKYNLLFYNMFKNVEIFMTIKDYDFEIDTQETRAVKNEGLYFLVLETLTTLFIINLLTLLIFVNEITYQMWHERLKHLNQQNVLQFVNQRAFDLKKSFSQNACVSCARDVERSENHNDHIVFDRWKMNLIHVDIMKSFSDEYNDAYYICTWLNDKIKRSHTDYLTNKASEKVFIFFKNFLNQNEHENNKCIWIRIDNDSKYFEKIFRIWRENRDIKTKFITAENFEMNDCVKRLNQTFMQKINIMLKNADLPKKWWSKVIIIVNFYRNISSVVDLKNKINRFIISFEVFTSHMYNYNHLRRVNQLNEALNIKLSTDWKKLIDHIKSMILIDYEEKHIYRMIDWNNKIKRVFNVYWLNHKKPSKQQKNQINKSARIDNIRSV